MKRLASVFIAFVMTFTLVGCDSAEDHIGEAKTPSGSSIMKGQQYQEVIEDFEENGFTNVKTEKLEDLVTGWMTKDGEVEKVSVGGDADYSPDKWVSNDTAVIITYHTFPEKKESSEPESTPDEEQKETSSSSESVDNAKKVEVLTVDNSDNFKNLLLLKNTSDSSISDFAVKYKGYTVEFDGHIAHIDNHKNANTRYDILIYAGDHSESNAAGPQFKLEDVGVHDLGIKELYLPEFVSVGVNVKIIAEIENFDSASELLMLDPVLITERKKEMSTDKNNVKTSEPSQANVAIPSDSSSKTTVSTTAPPKTNPVQNTERKVYWADSGTKIHTSASCRTIKSDANSGTESDAIAAGRTGGYCKVCS